MLIFLLVHMVDSWKTSSRLFIGTNIGPDSCIKNGFRSFLKFLEFEIQALMCATYFREILRRISVKTFGSKNDRPRFLSSF